MTTTPVALARDLPVQRVMRAQVDGCDLAIWRGISGQVQAWENRCPHRGMRLSYGFVRQDSLACAYHGWHYNCEAVCHYIPAHPELQPPASIKPVTYSVVEHQGVLWVNTRNEAEVPEFPEDSIGIRSITFDCPLSVAFEACLAAQLSDEAGLSLSPRQLGDAPLILSFGNQQQADSVLLLFQPSDLANVVIHVLAHHSYSVDGRIGISQWCESVRRQAELNHEVAMNAGMECTHE